ncbi:MAG: hypothetical protein ACT4RN_07560 [Pseudonocardia sp.]
MTWGRRGAAALAAVLTVLGGCGAAAGVDRDAPVEPGRGEFTFDGYPPLADRPVRVHYHAPPDPSRAQVLIVMHGLTRDAESYLDDWVELVGDRNVLVLAPTFSDEHYPGAEGYNTGNVVDADGDPRPAQDWNFHVVEALFDAVVADTGNPARDYALFGHSAGGQFVHRFVEFMPEHRARVAVAANAGWYTLPDESVAFPHGLDGVPLAPGELAPAFASNLVVVVGADDNDPDDGSLRRDEQTDRQGEHRLARGLNFFEVARASAAEEGHEFRWRLQVVPGLAHDHGGAARAAAPLLLAEPT